MKFRIFSAISLLYILAVSCAGDSAGERIHLDFETRRAEVARPGLYAVFDSDMTRQERQAMEFLYAYMPMPDMTDYTGEFYLDNVRASIKAREEMPWGRNVPEREFRHFVIPVRVNNESLDSSRMVFYAELKDRVKDLSMTDAILEINHWCHEKATYRPSDARTNSPLATVRSALGRCGEESTFAVAAFRAMGIPARQVYTPRWAHTDDNHAWVEAWADGKWYFLGACEPEPVLDMGWFNAPASRGMMMNTKVMGSYDGPEEQLGSNKCYTEINVTANYAPVDVATVTVVDVDGNPVEGAMVEFKLYNYGEFYSIARKTSDAGGHATLTSGLGDMLVWASHDGRFGFDKVSVSSGGGCVTVVLDKDSSTGGVWEFDMVPPVQSVSLPSPSAEQIAVNESRKIAEDSIRMAYMATFRTGDGPLLSKAAGNHDVIAGFLDSHAGDTLAYRLLEVLSDKDLGDVTTEVLEDHFATPRQDSPLFVGYVMNPRVGNERLTPYKNYLSSVLEPVIKSGAAEDPYRWVRWCADSIVIDGSWNPQGLCMSPRQVYDGRVTDPVSRDVFFVAGARSMGIPARLDPVTGTPQYADASGSWHDAVFHCAVAPVVSPHGRLSMSFEPAGRLTDPLYYSHFTLSAIGHEGQARLLEYPEEGTLSSVFTPSATVGAGQYMLVSGQRMASGTVLARVEIFGVPEDGIASPCLVMRQDSDDVQVVGSFNSENLYYDLEKKSAVSILSTTGRGYYVIALAEPNHEPSAHMFNDIAQYSTDFDTWGRSILVLFRDSDAASRFDRSRFGGLPANIVYGADIDGRIAGEFVSSLDLDVRQLPVVLIADTFNRVVYMSQGYSIGLGERLVDTLHKVGR